MGALDYKYLPNYTYEDYLLFEGKWEIIDGIAFAMSPAPMKNHQRISNNIAWALKDFLKDCERCEAYLPIDYKVSDTTILQPDNSVLCDDSLDAPYITKAPLIIFEILSKSTAMRDMNIKYEIYQNEGVKYYIIVNSDDSMAKLYKLSKGKYIKEGDFDKQKYTFEIEDCHLEFDFSKIW